MATVERFTPRPRDKGTFAAFLAIAAFISAPLELTYGLVMDTPALPTALVITGTTAVLAASLARLWHLSKKLG